MAFTSSVAGEVLGVRFYKGTQDIGTHVGTLWGPDGRALSTVTFANETASGWQFALFSSPILISPTAQYVVSYTAPVGRYSVTTNDLRNARTSGPLTTVPNGGRYNYSTGLPTLTSAHNYWVDVIFRPTP